MTFVVSQIRKVSLVLGTKKNTRFNTMFVDAREISLKVPLFGDCFFSPLFNARFDQIWKLLMESGREFTQSFQM